MLSALKVKHSHMRAACLARNLLVVDEVHASDTYMRGILGALLDAHLGAGGYALLMSATLGSAARRRWLAAMNGGRPDGLSLKDAIDSPYPAVSTPMGRGEKMTTTEENGQQKTVRIDSSPEMDRFEKVARRALTAARGGAKVLVVRNTVDYAVRTQGAVERISGADDRDLLFGLGGLPAPQHGRFAAADRRRLDRRLEERMGKERSNLDGGLVVVGTQTWSSPSTSMPIC